MVCKFFVLLIIYFFSMDISIFFDASELTNKWDPDFHILFSDCEDVLIAINCPRFVPKSIIKTIAEAGNIYIMHKRCRNNSIKVLFRYHLKELGKCKQLYYFHVSMSPKVVPGEIRYGPFLIGPNTCDDHQLNCEHNKFIQQTNICASTKIKCSNNSNENDKIIIFSFSFLSVCFIAFIVFLRRFMKKTSRYFHENVVSFI